MGTKNTGSYDHFKTDGNKYGQILDWSDYN